MKDGRVTLHIIQDLATPHNNSLVSALRGCHGLKVVTWYAMRTSRNLPWKKGLAMGEDNYYFDNWLNRWRLAQTFLFCPSEKFMVIGYANFGSCFILLASWVLTREFMYWTDYPQDRERSFLRSRIRTFLLNIVKRRGRPIFLVGKQTVEKFRHMGFPEDRLTNLPIFIDIHESQTMHADEILALRNQYGVHQEEVLFVGASRLVYNKGFDLLVGAVSQIPPAVLCRLKVLIIGTGPEKEKLHSMVSEKQLGERILFEDWLEPEDYKRVISAADVFVHPARFDAFGGGTLFAMAMGVPVLGSKGAGAAFERIEPGVNGLLSPAEDIRTLAEGMIWFVEHPGERRRMGLEARMTAEKWKPELGAKIILDALKIDSSSVER